MPVARKTTKEERERLARARARGNARAHDPSAVIGAHYDAARDTIDLRFRGGGLMSIPREVVSEVADIAPSNLGAIETSPAGDAVSFRAHDVDIYVPGLVERAFGTRLFARASGQKGGQRRSKAKAAAARANGAKGGRPRKRLSA